MAALPYELPFCGHFGVWGERVHGEKVIQGKESHPVLLKPRSFPAPLQHHGQRLHQQNGPSNQPSVLNAKVIARPSSAMKQQVVG